MLVFDDLIFGGIITCVILMITTISSGILYFVGVMLGAVIKETSPKSNIMYGGVWPSKPPNLKGTTTPSQPEDSSGDTAADEEKGLPVDANVSEATVESTAVSSSLPQSDLSSFRLGIDSNHIRKLYKTYWGRLNTLMRRVLKNVDIDTHDIESVIKDESNKCDADIINNLRELNKTTTTDAYTETADFKRAKWAWHANIRPMLRYGLPRRGILDYGGRAGNTAYKIGREILGLPKEKVFVVDGTQFGGVPINPHVGITFINYEEIDIDKLTQENNGVDLIIASNVLHHVNPPALVERIIEMFNRILSPRGVIVLYEHDCDSLEMKVMLDIEHCLYDVVVSKRMSYVEYVSGPPAHYLPKEQWRDKFSKYFRRFADKMNNTANNNFYMYFDRK